MSHDESTEVHYCARCKHLRSHHRPECGFRRHPELAACGCRRWWEPAVYGTKATIPPPSPTPPVFMPVEPRDPDADWDDQPAHETEAVAETARVPSEEDGFDMGLYWLSH